MRALGCVLLGASLLLAGCGEGVGPVPGSFTVTVTGDLQLTLSGVAVFGTTTSRGVEGLVIQLIRGDPGSADFDVVAIARYGTARPQVGGHAIVSAFCTDCTPGVFDAVFAMHRNDASFARFRSGNGGTLTIDESESDRLVGSFSFPAIAFSTSSGIEADTVTVSGTFTAVSGNVSPIG